MKLTRRDFLSALSIGVVGSTLGSCRQSKRIERPNVLFIAIDDLNDWSSVMGGHPQAITPNIERLARRSVTFTNAYTAAAACNPSQTALMTGLPPYIYPDNRPVNMPYYEDMYREFG